MTLRPTERVSIRFTDFGRALVAAGVDPGTVEVSLPAVQWERLSAALNADTEGAFEETAPNAPRDNIEIMGVRYLVRFERQ